MSRLKPHECRVLGVLVEKAYTTPAQYPLTLNSLVSGANQKNNRDPVTRLSEDDVLDALDGLRAKQLAREVMMSGSRVQKYRQVARETLEASTTELVVLAELLLRGPQTEGELRGRASRMHPLESLDVVRAVLDALMTRDEPIVARVAPAPGSRAARYAQLLCPGLHPVEAAPAATDGSAAPAARVSHAPAPAAAAGPEAAALKERIERLEGQVAALQRKMEDLTGPPT